ncbi:hypothetical protein KHM83_08250 [Fusibacter paucivorans]|uniref:Uncharacterized protein n=1 Tax=Fusibacter paucivorans TaxID=76009 RepID=A0ABS5PNB0_9FIRM|nr:hypothetical protein [Fusibacter paucivorans]MBS7526665.1 hypothetical protein [Fusibacter paucivorans]
MRKTLRCVRNLALAGMIADSAIMYKTHRKYQTMVHHLDRMLWMSRQVIRLGTDDLASERIGVAYSQLVIDLTEADLTHDILLTITGDYARIRLLINADTRLRLNGTVHFANVSCCEKPSKIVDLAEKPHFLSVHYTLRYATMEIEVIP